MLLIEHYIGQSPIAGAGLFCAESIARGQAVYRFDPRFVQLVLESEIAQLPVAARNALDKYTYRGHGADRLTGARYYCTDDSRFMNHSDAPNIRWDDASQTYYAVADIAARSEITCDYREFSEVGDYPFIDDPN
ncbi:SET domain-containing protein-lysine N-methyltransferase [Sinimarinibacterium sp. NLF-5-8]|uniref:SET domain-containing protein-lysine N-methyltransferase n=1 Tax=Sinimarinibacterium sp. NLF-5-8 TaxID=2698684 RepID=UPI00137BE402|nr:SET domain-containing protein [Sinimarinibacterium sp. NLF-5-8]QHS10509.1 SET domain-containing protein [Sinimarinibacterium sp. NLF-5-8]